MIIRAAIAAPFGLGVFSSLMLVPGYLGFAVSIGCYVLMMVALAARVPSFLTRGQDFDSVGSDKAGGGSLPFAALLGGARSLPAFAAGLPAMAKALPARVMAWLPFLRRERSEEEIDDDLPVVDAVLAELREEFAEEGLLDGAAEDGEAVKAPDDDVTVDDDLSSLLPDEAPELEAEPITGRFAFLKKLMRRLSKLPGVAYLLSLTVKLEVKRNPAEADDESGLNDPDPLFAGAVGPADDESDEDVPDDFVDIDAIDLGDRPSRLDRLLTFSAPLVRMGERIVGLAERLRRRLPASDGDETLEASQAVDADVTDEARPRVQQPSRTARQTALHVLGAVMRVAGWVLLTVLVLPVLLADLLITAVRNRLASRATADDTHDEEADDFAPTPRRTRQTTPASLYGEYQDAA